jgi:hypothetical protein
MNYIKMPDVGFDDESVIYTRLEFFNNLLLRDSQNYTVNLNKILDNDSFLINHKQKKYKIGYCVGGSHGLNAIYNEDYFVNINKIHKSYIDDKSVLNTQDPLFINWKNMDMDIIIKSFDLDLHLFIDEKQPIDAIDILEGNESRISDFIKFYLNNFISKVTHELNIIFNRFFYPNEQYINGYFFNLKEELRLIGYELVFNSDNTLFKCTQASSLSTPRDQFRQLGKDDSYSNIFGRIYYSIKKKDSSDIVHNVFLYDIAWERSFNIHPYQKFQANNVMKYHNSHQIKYYFNNNLESIKMFSLYDIIKNYISLIEQPKYRKKHKSIIRSFFIMNILKNKDLFVNEIKKEIIDDPVYKRDLIIILEKYKYLLNNANLKKKNVRNIDSFNSSYKYISESDNSNFDIPFNLDDADDIIRESRKFFFTIDKNGDNYIINYGENSQQNYDNFVEVIDFIIQGINDDSLLQNTIHDKLSIDTCALKFKEYLSDDYNIGNFPIHNKKYTMIGLLDKYKKNMFELDNIVNINTRYITKAFEENSLMNRLKNICEDILNGVIEKRYISSENGYFIAYCPISYSYNGSKRIQYLKKLNNGTYFHTGFIYGTTDYNMFIEKIDRYHDIAILLINYQDVYYLENNEIILPVGTNFYIIDDTYLKYNKNSTHIVFGIVKQQKDIDSLDSFQTYFNFEYFHIDDIEPANFNKIITDPNDYILSNISPYNNIFKLKYINLKNGIYGLSIPENTKLFSENNKYFSYLSAYSYRKPIEYKLMEKSFFINLSSLLNLNIPEIQAEKDLISSKIIDFTQYLSFIQYGICNYGVNIYNKNLIPINKFEKLHSKYTIFTEYFLSEPDDVFDKIIKKVNDITELNIAGILVPTHFIVNIDEIANENVDTEEYNVESIFQYKIFPDSLIVTKDVMRKNELSLFNKSNINTDKILNEINNYISRSNMDLTFKTLGVSNYLKDVPDEQRFKKIYDFYIKHNSRDEYRNKYEKYKIKYNKLKNKIKKN